MQSYSLTQTVLCLDNVSFGYPDPNNPNKLVPILENISLIEKDIVRPGHTATGQCVALLGLSGRGKSTLMKLLTGLNRPTSGRVLVTNTSTENSEDAVEVSEGQVGFVSQKYTTFRHKTIQESLLYALRKSKESKQQKLEKINNWLINWNLEKHKDKYPNELSGGQRQRMAILEQIATSKHFMVMDEPASGLDFISTEKLKDSFKRISEEDELNTIIFSTHDINLAVELADSIYILGYPEGKNVSTIIKHFDLKEMGLAWQEFGNSHLNLVNEIKEVLRKS